MPRSVKVRTGARAMMAKLVRVGAGAKHPQRGRRPGVARIIAQNFGTCPEAARSERSNPFAAETALLNLLHG